jgi:putative transposase
MGTDRPWRWKCLFGEVVNGVVILNEMGKIVKDEWFKTTRIRAYVVLNCDEFVVMPKHIYGIIWIIETDENLVGGRRRRAPTYDALSNYASAREQFGKPIPGSIPTIIRSYKSAVTRRINLLLDSPGAPIWQRNYYEHIIRNYANFERIYDYIHNNPVGWEEDRFYEGDSP